MTKPTIAADAIQIPITYLLKQYKKDSGYKKAKKIHGASDVTKHIGFDPDAFICHTIHEIADNHTDRCPNIDSVDVHAAFKKVAPFMFKAEHNNEDFIFGWLKKPFVEAIYNEESEKVSNTEQRIRILSMIALLNPDAVLNIKLTPL